MKTLAQRLAIAYLAATSVIIGIWAQFAPRSFYDAFPGFGHVWVGIDGPYNEHLIRDVGGLNLALAAVLIVAAVSLDRMMVLIAALASLIYGLPHVAYHIANHRDLDTTDVVASVGGLLLSVALSAWLLYFNIRPSPVEPT